MKKFGIAFLLVSIGIAMGLFIKAPNSDAQIKTTPSPRIAIKPVPVIEEQAEESTAVKREPITKVQNQTQSQPCHSWLKPEDVQQTTEGNNSKVVFQPAEQQSMIVTTQQPVEPQSMIVTTHQPVGQMIVTSSQPIEYTTTVSGYGVAVGGPLKAVDSGEINPYWTVGTNGLIQNPCVDPPSANRHLQRQ